MLNVLGRRHLRRALVILRILPEILEPINRSEWHCHDAIEVKLVLIGRFHFGACLRRAKFGDSSVKKVYLVVEVDHCKKQLG